MKNQIHLKNIQEKLEKEKFINSINIFQFNDKDYDFPNLSGSHVSFATYFRLFIENYLPNNFRLFNLCRC